MHVLPAFGPLPLEAVTSLAIREWLSGLEAGGLSRHTARQAKQVLGAVLTLAVEERLLPKNPAARVRVGRSARIEQQFLTDSEVSLLAGAIDPRYRVLVWFLAYSGLRWGEAAALRRGDVRAGSVRVWRSLSEVGGAHLKETKTGRARTVVLPGFVSGLLAEHLAVSVGPTPEALVFTAPAGGALHSRNFRRRAWRPALAAAGLSPNFRIHDLRHTAAALLLSEGASPADVQRHLGHSSIAVTMDNYGHLLLGDVEALAQRMDVRIRRVLDKG